MVERVGVTVTVVTTKNPERLKKCLSSLGRAARTTPLTVYVTDNATDYDVKEIAQASYPESQIIRNQARQGVTRNRNEVLRLGRTKYLLTLDDDVELGDNCVDLMYKFMEGHPEAGQVGAALYEKSWFAMPVPCGYAISSFPYPLRICLLDLLKGVGLSKFVERLAKGSAHHRKAREQEVMEVAGVITACSLIRMSAVCQVGLFDEGYRIYLDDLDFSTRLRAVGWRCYQTPGARVIHHISSSYNPETKRNVARGCLRYARKFYPYPVFVVTFILTIIVYFIKFFKE